MFDVSSASSLFIPLRCTSYIIYYFILQILYINMIICFLFKTVHSKISISKIFVAFLVRRCAIFILEHFFIFSNR